MTRYAKVRILRIASSLIVALLLLFTLQLNQSQASGGLLEFLKFVSGIRGPLVLYDPHGRVSFEERLTFRWGYTGENLGRPVVDHFVIRVSEEVEDPKLEPREIWMSGEIPGDVQSHTAVIAFENPFEKSYLWRLEPYEKGSADPVTQEELPFSFLNETESETVRSREKVLLGWIEQQPKEEHLLLLLGSYYASMRMYFPARNMFARFLKIDENMVYSYKDLTQSLLERLKQVEKTRDALRIALTNEPINESARLRMLSDLLGLNLALLDYGNALSCANELIALSGLEDERATWQKKKEMLIAEQSVADAIFHQ